MIPEYTFRWVPLGECDMRLEIVAPDGAVAASKHYTIPKDSLDMSPAELVLQQQNMRGTLAQWALAWMLRRHPKENEKPL